MRWLLYITLFTFCATTWGQERLPPCPTAEDIRQEEQRLAQVIRAEEDRLRAHFARVIEPRMRRLPPHFVQHIREWIQNDIHTSNYSRIRNSQNNQQRRTALNQEGADLERRLRQILHLSPQENDRTQFRFLNDSSANISRAIQMIYRPNSLYTPRHPGLEYVQQPHLYFYVDYDITTHARPSGRMGYSILAAPSSAQMLIVRNCAAPQTQARPPQTLQPHAHELPYGLWDELRDAVTTPRNQDPPPPPNVQPDTTTPAR